MIMSSSSILSSSGLVFATAMVVSSTAVFLAFFKQNKTDTSPTQLISDRPDSDRNNKHDILRSCLCPTSGGNKERKKKKVQFAENVKKQRNEEDEKDIVIFTDEDDSVDEEFKKKTDRKLKKNRCRNNCVMGIPVRGMPENRVALYNAILRDRSHSSHSHRLAYSC